MLFMRILTLCSRLASLHELLRAKLIKIYICSQFDHASRSYVSAKSITISIKQCNH